jgi:hypothetical protein
MSRPKPKRKIRSLSPPIPPNVGRDGGTELIDRPRTALQDRRRLLSLRGVLRDRLTADEFTRLSNDGEALR